MRDRLENFVMEHRDQFDLGEPNPNNWNQILSILESDASDNTELEGFVQTHRQQFDKQLPSADIWSKIDQQISPQKTTKRIPLLRMMKYAAAAVFLLAVGAWGGQFILGTTDEGGLNIAASETLPPEVIQMEKFYQSQVEQKHAQLASYDFDAVVVNEDLSELDKMLQELREELKDTPKGSEEQIVNAMIKNYESKIAILEIVLERIKSIQPSEKRINQKRIKDEEATSM